MNMAVENSGNKRDDEIDSNLKRSKFQYKPLRRSRT